MRQALRAAKKRVLIVDDDEQVRDIASLFVEELGYPVSTASNAIEALQILQQDRTVDVLFSDITMPGMDGEQLAERARALRPDLRIILTSGGRRPQAKVAFVPKPFHAVDLIQVLPPLPLTDEKTTI
jgi:CheY-like chemotaxis protein